MDRMKVLAAAMLLTTFGCAQAQVLFDFDFARRGPMMSEDHYGIFYEEINHAGDGGLYAELIHNRSFEDNADNPDKWWTVGNATMSIATDNMLNPIQEHAMRVQMNVANTGVRNEGFWGINVVSGRKYTLSFWMRADDSYTGSIAAELQNSSGASLGRTIFTVNATREWKKYTATITATGNDTRGYLALIGNKPGTVVYDVVSLFPPTFKNRRNGCREDLAQMLADLHPRFMRFPGGCYIEGAFWAGSTNRFEWRKTVGPIEERPGHLNRNWGYRVSDGLGYHEMLQLSEDIGAAPMFVVNIGIGHDWTIIDTDIDPFVQEALDAIEYANGSTDTFYGRMRAENGHPEPFNLKYMEIGNEQEFMLNREDYLRRYMQFYRAIKTKWPDVHLIADSYYFDNVTEPVELKDEHYYESPEFFISQYGRYDKQSASSTKIYVGEYAVTKECGWWGNLNAAIGEAVFMEGSENNSEAVTMMSYAPIFTHEENYAWHPDMIRFNSSLSYGTPSYYVQRMFANNVGKQNIRWTETNNGPQFDTTKGSVGVGTWATAATFTGLRVTASDTTFYVNNAQSADWKRRNGSWLLNDSTFNQTNNSATDVTCVLDRQFTTTNVDLWVRARKNSGSEGFLIVFDYKDAQNYAWFNIGGWGNTQHAVEQCKNGAKSTLATKSGSLTTGRDYLIHVVKEGQRVRCYMDGELIIDTNLSVYADRSVYASANIDDEAGVFYVKLVNPSNQSQDVTLSFQNGRALSGTAEVLSSPYGTDENTVTNPFYIKPKSQNVSVNAEGKINYRCAAFSVNVLQIKVDDVVVPQPEPLPTPRLSFSFDNGTPVDDSNTYTARLMNNSSIEQLSDGNYAFFSGKKGGKGYLYIPVDAVKNALGNAEEYTISLNVMQRTANNLGNFSWAFAAVNGTSQYLGIINAGGNSNWYVQLKNSSTTNTVDSWSCLRINEWHNITYTQADGTARLYVDGQLRATMTVTLLPKQFIGSITGAYLARSPFGSDAYMENAVFDELKIYDQALSEEQVKEIAARAIATEYDDRYDGIADLQNFETLIKEVKNYYEDAGDEELTRTYNAANRSSSSSESVKLQLYANLLAAVNNYQEKELEKALRGKPANLTFLITNSSFTRYNVGWQGLDIPQTHNGTSYSGYTNETGERFSHDFDIWQEIDNLPEGNYTLSCSAFYRAGAIAPAYEAWNNSDPSTKSACLYMNDEEVPLVNLFSSTAYTYSPYTYPDNLISASSAFNTQKEYGDNALTIHLDEGQSLRLGIHKLKTVANDWVSYDNFRLRYEGSPTAVDRTEHNQSPVLRTEYYSVDGRRIMTSRRNDVSDARCDAAPVPHRGVVIVKQFHADGSVTTHKRLW